MTDYVKQKVYVLDSSLQIIDTLTPEEFIQRISLMYKVQKAKTTDEVVSLLENNLEEHL
jgi:ABC-type multidrug transport system ATPase subunit